MKLPSLPYRLTPLLCSLLVLAACGGGDSALVAGAPTPAPAASPATPSTPAAVTGVFLDAAVEGLEYAGSAGSKGSTNAKGEFNCKTGETVTFGLGGITLGSAACGTIITPLTLAGLSDVKDDRVMNRLLALQLLDEDGDPSNGIKITAATKTALASRTLDFAISPSAFNAALTSTLALLPDAYKLRTVDDDRRALVREHFEDTLASKASAPVVETVAQSSLAGSVTASITRYTVQASDSFYIPYEGAKDAIKADFPKGFLPSYGSGLAFKGKRADGTLEFYGLTDRGPNGDGPNVTVATGVGTTTTVTTAKYFPSPSFVPSFGLITVGKDGAVLQSSTPLRFNVSAKASGLSLAPGKVGSSGEAPLLDDARYDTTKTDYSDYGLDTEAIVVDAARGVLWISDEYGPFIIKVDPATGNILKKYQPGTGPADLPAVLAKRRANRGMEGLTLDKTTQKLHGFLQSPLTDSLATGTFAGTVAGQTTCTIGTGSNKRIERYARFTRWIEFDPTTETSKMYAYPLDCNDYAEGRTGNAKLGDMVSLGNGKYIVIEQGLAPSGKVRNRLMLVELGLATDISAAGYNPATSDLEKSSMSGVAVNSANYTTVVAMKKTQLFDLNTAGWLAEKAEGLALVDDSTLALTNDNDFGLKTTVYNASGSALAGADITACTATTAGAFDGTGDATNCASTNSARVGRGADSERPTRLWLIKFGKKLSDYAIP